MSELDNLIPPEIVNDSLYDAIKELASKSEIDTMLEIGSSSGEGSTKAFLEGMKANDWSILYCLEISQARFDKLLEAVGKNDRVVCVNMSSVNLEDFPNEQQVTKFYRDIYSVLNMYRLDTVLGWLKQDKAYLEEFRWSYETSQGGIDYIKKKYEVKDFDIVLIDGSEFTGYPEFKKVYGSRFIILDDIRSFKNYFSYRDLLSDSDYMLHLEDKNVRNGFAIFEKK